MASTFPTTLDDFTNPVATDVLGTASGGVGVARVMSDLNDAVEGLEAKVGIDSSAVTTSHDRKLSNVTGSDKAASVTGTETLTNKTLTSPVINTPTGDVATLTGTQTLTNKTLTTPTIANLRGYDGWNDANETWTYASASTFTVPTDLTAKYVKGTKIKWTQTTVKYGVVVASSFGASTTVTIAVNTDYTIANAAISANFYSYETIPQGWPDWFSFTAGFTGFSVNPTVTLSKWRIEGKTCFIRYIGNANGTSNTTGFTITGFPVSVATNEGKGGCLGILQDNGVTSGPLYGTVSTSTIILSNSATTDAGWTNSGGKHCYGFSIFYEWN